MKFLVVSASPVKDGNTERLLSLFVQEAVLKRGVEVDLWRLVETPPPRITGRLEDWKPWPELERRVSGVDGLVVATPTYWFGIPGILKDWLDNLTPLAEHRANPLVGKPFGVVVYGPEGGAIGPAQYVSFLLNHLGMVAPPYAAVWWEGNLSENQSQNWWVKDDVRTLVQRMLETLE